MTGARFVGRVVSNRMQKTVVVAVDYLVWRPKLKTYEKRTGKHFAHDEKQACEIGDTVRIAWTRRRSKHKSYAVEEVLRRADVFTPELGAAAARRAEQGRAELAATTRSQLAERAYEAAKQRLAALRALRARYDQEQQLQQQQAPGAGAAQAAAGGGSSGGSQGG